MRWEHSSVRTNAQSVQQLLVRDRVQCDERMEREILGRQREQQQQGQRELRQVRLRMSKCFAKPK